jgi:hypothetical protein
MAAADTHHPNANQSVLSPTGTTGKPRFPWLIPPQQRADPQLEAAIRLALVPHIAATLLNQASQPHAT